MKTNNMGLTSCDYTQKDVELVNGLGIVEV
jgi:hypothetical protein